MRGSGAGGHRFDHTAAGDAEQVGDLGDGEPTTTWFRRSAGSAGEFPFTEPIPARCAALANLSLPKALVWTVEREARWREAVAAQVADGKTAAEARCLTPRPSH